MMKVGFDLSQTAHRGGVSIYTKRLAEQLSKIDSLEMEYFYSSLRRPYKGSLKHVKIFKLPPTFFEIFFNRIRNVSIERFLGPIDIFHSSDWVQPPSKAKKVTTYHDVIPLKYPQWSVPKIVEVHKRRLKIVEQEIDKVICVSEATKKDLLELSKIPEEKIVVIYEGVDSRFKKATDEEISNLRKKYNLPEKFILAIGGVGERKNLQRIANASEGLNLVVIGEGPKGVISLKGADDFEMPIFYSAAQVLVYASLYEGFGLPIIEAMKCGTPVITSNVSSMPEAGEDAAIYVNPEDENDIKNQIKRVLEDDNLRKEMIEKGYKQAEKFTWEKCAGETVSIYKDLLS